MTATTPAARHVSLDPRTGQERPAPPQTPPEDVAAVVAEAAHAAPELAAMLPRDRHALLDAAAEAIEAAAQELVSEAERETGLGRERLENELAGCARSARYYGHAAERAWGRPVSGDAPARLDVPLGPVAVFAASNFPFGFGVLGHDSSTALAAGCPVVLKSHPAHPRLAAALGRVVGDAVQAAGAPAGTFAVISGYEAGQALVDAPQIRAVGFTGSQAAGLSLVARAYARPRPIPVFAEMGTVNPVLVTRSAAAVRAEQIAREFVASMSLGTGQFCTKPGLLLVPAGAGLLGAVADEVRATGGGWLLSPKIADAHAAGTAALRSAGAVEVARGRRPDGGFAAAATLYAVDPDDLVEGSTLLEECFGPVALVAEYPDPAAALNLLARLQPSLAGVVHADGPTDPQLADAVDVLSAQVGRVVVDGWPTGVAVVDGMQHGGPWPATSRPDTTSVGAHALRRWVRPVCFQGVPAQAVPPSARAWRLDDQASS